MMYTKQEIIVLFLRSKNVCEVMKTTTLLRDWMVATTNYENTEFIRRHANNAIRKFSHKNNNS